MGRGNIRVSGDYEGLWYIDRDYIDCYASKEVDEYGEREYKMQYEIGLNDLDKFDYCDSVSEMFYDNYISKFILMMEKKFNSFIPTDDKYGTIMENRLFEIQIKDNEWSYAVMLIQKENDWDDSLSGLQKRHYQNYLDGMKNILLDMFPEIGYYDGMWSSGVIKRG